MKLFITGGTGSLGTALLAYAASNNIEATVYSRDEVKQGSLKQKYPQQRFVLGDVRDEEWLEVVMKGHDIVIHAAAYKQVPAAEVNSAQAIDVNVVGSRSVARAAVKAGVQHVIGISSDKACAPVNCYGATKMLMEKLFQEAGGWGDTQFTLVRYGNVLGSRGSVVPFFREQAKQGFITLTNPAMTRFWMTLQDAVDLVTRSINEQDSGVVIVPACKASNMSTMAMAIAPDAEIRIIGTRPGEKVNEQLINAAEAMHTSAFHNGFKIYPASIKVTRPMPEGFSYTSDVAPQLTVEQLREML